MLVTINTGTWEPPPVAIVASLTEEDDAHGTSSLEGEKMPRSLCPCTSTGSRPWAQAATRRAVGMEGDSGGATVPPVSPRRERRGGGEEFGRVLCLFLVYKFNLKVWIHLISIFHMC